MEGYIHASEVLTGSGIRTKDGRRVQEEDMGRVEDGAVVHDQNKILWVGSTSDLPRRYRSVRLKNLRGKRAVIPGLVDCHTHLVFAGDRSQEFADRCGGATYEEIAARGGGILTTVRATREASESLLLRLAVERLKAMMSYGVRAVEIKSGYGLDFETEMKILRVIRQLKRRFPSVAVQSTFLGAHAFPKDCSREDYIGEILNRMLPEVVRGRWADACDVFIDRGYYTLNEGRRILERARSLGLKVKVHADELANTESASLGVQLGALSVDHLLKISDRGIHELSGSNTVGVLLPGTAFYLKTDQAPARKLLDAGACVALSTDFNPGTCMSLSLPAMMTLAALYLGMTRAEIFSAVTYSGAKALGMHSNIGTIEVGMKPALAVLPFARFEELYYRFGW